MANKISVEQIKDLRQQTGAGMLEAKKVLEESGGDVDQAIELLRKRGQLKASKKAERETRAGLIESYIHGDGRIGVLVEVNSETDFVARNEEFKNLVHELALQIAAAAPVYVRREDVPAEVVAKEREIYAEAAKAEGKPGNVLEKIVDGKLEKFFEESCLLEQPYVKDQDKTVQDLITEKIAMIGENIQVRRFVRYVLGEN